jgi:membrane protein
MPVMHVKTQWASKLKHQLLHLLSILRTWPWRDTWHTVRLRFREDRLGMTASSLTFTTLISLVPMLTVMLALFTAFPIFAKFQDALQKYLLQSLVPDNIAKPVLAGLTQFSAKANQFGAVGLVLLVFTALALMPFGVCVIPDPWPNESWCIGLPSPWGLYCWA